MTDDDIMDIRAAEIAQLRQSLRAAKKQLGAAKDNDAIVGALHKLALLLISTKGQGGDAKDTADAADKADMQWREQAEKMLARALPTIAKCRILAAADISAATKRVVAKLPSGGAAKMIDESYAIAGLPSVYAVPLKKGAVVCGLLLLYARGKNAFPPGTANDFALRLGQLLAAAMAR